ncbi:MAG: tannase [Lachnospiraceae bacterium]|nr:tannase [Lachnospiraceae bacterium]
MMKIRKTLSLIMAAIMVLSVTAWGSETGSPDETVTETTEVLPTDTESDVQTNLAKIDSTAWQYNAEDDVYYQIGISYCENPADTSYETLAVFVPGAYMTAADNGDGTYTCEINTEGSIGSYTADTAPIVIPVNTPGYSAMAPLTSYSSFTEYTNEGFVYVHAGCRGRDSGAPAGVTDLKAAVRYIRYTDDVLPGDAESIFTFGMSGGGAQSALMGSTGDSDLYDAYLEEIGAVMGVSDAVLGSMCWCPITNLDTADEAYEWMMGVTRSGLSEEEQLISDSLAEAFAAYINSAGIKDEDGNVLTLSESTEGIYQSGTYYDYMKTVIEESLNNFLSDTEFPYDASSSGGMMGGPGGGMRGGNGGMSFRNGEKPDGERPGFGEGDGPDFGTDGKPDGEGAPSFEEGEMPDDMTDTESEQSFEAMDDITRNDTTGGLSLSGTYETAQDYIDALNTDGEWVIYDASTNTATITSIEDFVKAFKSASKNLGAFDQLDEGQGENTLFGYGDGNGAHFDEILSQILTDLGSSYASAYAEDLSQTDDAGNTVDVRLAMYTPLYYLLESSEGYETSTVARYWRIRTGITQSDCALSTEMNLALALENYSGVEDVDFETVWGAGHTQAERTGSSTGNFIAWVNECMSEA